MEFHFTLNVIESTIVYLIKCNFSLRCSMY